MVWRGSASGVKAAGADVDDAVDDLQRAFDQQQRRGVDDGAVALEDVGRDDGVADAGLVLEGEEAEALRRAGALADDDQAGDLGPAAVALPRQIAGAQHALRVHVRAQVLHEMRADGHAGAFVVGERAVLR